MTFVYPLLLGGLLLAGLPVLLHLLVRQKPKVLLFPAFRFLVQKRRSNTRSLRLRHLLLLLLRIALIVLLCLALARPRILHEQLGMSRERPVALVLIFDTSASMGYQVGEATRLDLAKKHGLELIDQLPEDCRVLVLDSADARNFARSGWLPSLAKARQVVQGLTVRPDGTPVTKALAEAQRRFDDWDRTEEDPESARLPRVICIFTDRTRGSWEGAKSPNDASADATKIQTLLFDVGVDDPIDRAIVNVLLPADERGGMKQSFAKGEKVALHAAVRGTGEKETVNAVLTCLGADQPISHNVLIDPGQDQSAKLEIDTAKLNPGFHQTVLKLDTETDQLPFNNQRFMTFELRQPQRVLILGDDTKQSDLLARWLRAFNYQVDQRSVKDPKAPGEIFRYDAVFLDGVADPDDKVLWPALADFVEKKGGGLGIAPGGDGLQRDAYQTQAAQRVMPGKIVDKVNAPADRPARWNDAAWDLDRPFFRRFRSWFETEQFIPSLPAFARHYWRIEPRRDADTVVLVQYDDGRPALLERSFAKGGTVLLFTTPLDETTPPWNNYRASIHWFFEALTMLSVRHLCPAPFNPALNFEFGQEPPRVKLVPGYQKYLLVGPGVAEEIRADGDWLGAGLMAAGNYAIFGLNDQEKTTLAAFSINVPASESDLGRVPISDIEMVLGPGAVVPQDRKTSLPHTLNWDEPVELFPWLMLALLFAFALENLLANRFYRRDSESAA